MSSSWSARFLRERVAEWGRDVPPAPESPSPPNGMTTRSRSRGSGTPPCSSTSTASVSSPTRRCSLELVWTLAVGSFGPLRLVQCALAADELPEIDLVLVSHAHFDHLDTPSLGAIRGTPAAVMAAATSDLLPSRRYSSVRELRWNESTKVVTRHGEALVRSIEVNHWGARIGRDVRRGYTGFIVEREGRRLLLAETRHRPTCSGRTGASARSTPRSCPSAPTIRGSATTARRSRRSRWRMPLARACSCPCTTSPFS